jgi:hypothetical protein
MVLDETFSLLRVRLRHLGCDQAVESLTMVQAGAVRDDDHLRRRLGRNIQQLLPFTGAERIAVLHRVSSTADGHKMEFIAASSSTHVFKTQEACTIVRIGARQVLL